VGGVLVQEGARNSAVGSNLAANVLTLALQSKDTIKVDTVKDKPNVFVDAFATNEVDVADLAGFFNKSNTLGAAVLSHVINERAFAISQGVGYLPAHQSALSVESRVMGANYANRKPHSRICTRRHVDMAVQGCQRANEVAISIHA
jgi:hypothetical protein